MPALFTNTSSAPSGRSDATASLTESSEVTSRETNRTSPLSAASSSAAVLPASASHAPEVHGPALGGQAPDGFLAESLVCSCHKCSGHGQSMDPETRFNQGPGSLGLAVPGTWRAPSSKMEGWIAKSWRRFSEARREVSPAEAGLPAGSRRRVTGLRREEVAQLASLSVDYIVRLEQGRGPRPSDAVLISLARALRLSDDERSHLFNLSGSAPPRPGQIDGVVRSSTLRVLERLVDLPVLVLDAKGDVLAWNAQATALLGDFSAWGPPTRNILWQRFLGHEPRVSRRQRRMSAQLPSRSPASGPLRPDTPRTLA